MIVPTKIANRAVTSPCDGTVVRFRLSGYVRPANSYSIRVMRRGAGNDFTGLAKSAAVQIQQTGINTYATNLPIAAGDYIGIDFENSTEEHGLNWVFGSGVYEHFVYLAFNGSGSAPIIEDSHYLFNADVECGSKGPPTAPSNEFTIGKVAGRSVSVTVKSAGLIQVTDAAAKKSGKAKTPAKGKKRKPKLLKPSSARGSAGEIKVPLKLTGAAKAILKAKGKVKVKARFVFTPDGGTAASQVKKLTIKVKKPSKR